MRYGWAALPAVLGFVAILACEKRSQEAEKAVGDTRSVVLARVGDEVVTVDDLGFVPVRVKPSNRLEMLVMRKLAAAEARRRGLADLPRTREKLAEFRNSALTWEEGLLRNALYNSIRQDLTFDEQELLAHYEQTKSRYTEPQWKLLVRKFADEAEARAADAELGATGRLDPAQSESLGPLAAGQFPPDLLPVLPGFKQPGDRQLLDREGAWSLFELVEYLPAAPVPFETVREKINQDLRAARAEQIFNEKLEKLRAEQVVIDEAALAKVEKERNEVAEGAKAHRIRRALAEQAPAEKAPTEQAPTEQAPTEQAPADAP